MQERLFYISELIGKELNGTITVEELSEAAEIFLTNAIHGIRWVKQLGENRYSNLLTQQLHRQLLQSLA